MRPCSDVRHGNGSNLFPTWFLCRVIPIIVAFHRIAYIAETYSLILAISELNMEVLCKFIP
jgi:hypothetical protein